MARREAVLHLRAPPPPAARPQRQPASTPAAAASLHPQAPTCCMLNHWPDASLPEMQRLRRLSLEGLPAAGSGPDGAAPAPLSRRTLSLCLATRQQVEALAALELQLLGASAGAWGGRWRPLARCAPCCRIAPHRSRLPCRPHPGAAAPPPSILQGAFVRYRCGGAYRLDWVTATRVDPASGGLLLSVSGLGAPVRPATLSASNPLAPGAWEAHGQAEVAALRQQLPAPPTCLEVRCWVRWLGGAAAADLRARPATALWPPQPPAGGRHLLPPQHSLAVGAAA